MPVMRTNVMPACVIVRVTPKQLEMRRYGQTYIYNLYIYIYKLGTMCLVFVYWNILSFV